MDCKLMLKEAFAYAKKGVFSGSGGSFPIVHAVFVNVTLHQSSDVSNENRDVVWYANGPLSLTQGQNEEILSGTIQAWINSTKLIELKPKPGEISVPVVDLFPFTPQTTLKVTVSASGFVSVQILINNKAFLGRPPVEFQATCNNGLLTAVIGSTSYTLSFTLGKKQ